ncbi:MAG: hypothetical protein B6U68_01700 [Candidatus Aenigmarchaeota archaeon ex4484_14]|nr:UPF0147 family protein [Candidatus Aenigmarchaeota archaeon]OYT57548.1 MAG: hypothetical protein B6U68_01700 [Candidatus Aenigmarchaeota archaeon ex4484_14]
MSIAKINELLEQIKNDRTVPKNVRNSIEIAQNDLTDKSKDALVKINSAISILEEASNDTNIPTYTRTQIWNIISMLEVLNEKQKRKKGN